MNIEYLLLTEQRTFQTLICDEFRNVKITENSM